MQFSQFFSLDSPKAIKARAYGYMNAINYMAPHKLSGMGNLCGNASPACIELCLGKTSGAAVYYPAVLKSRIAKARLFFSNRTAFMREMMRGIERAIAAARRLDLEPCVRPNGSSDVPWEAVKVPAEAYGQAYANIMEAFPDVQFVDYTKNVKRALRHAAGLMPRNYHLTFSRSEENEADCIKVLASGGNVSVVSSAARPETYLGHPTIDGDAHDLRHLDEKGVVVWLSPKGLKAQRDRSGFVVR
jgi:hypothetical protein